MLRKAIIVSLVVMSSLLCSELLPADIILLKRGGVMQGKVLSETKASIEFKNSSGKIEMVRRRLVSSIVKREEKLSLLPEDVYQKRLKSISATDAMGHYDLGLYCFENNLLDYALEEFNRSKVIDSHFEKMVTGHIKYIKSVKKKVEQITGVKSGVEEEKPPLTQRQIEKELEKGDLAVPCSREDAELISRIINNLAVSGLKEEYAQRYLELASYFEKAQMGGRDARNKKNYYSSLLCYEIAYNVAQDGQTKTIAQQKIRSTEEWLKKRKKAEFIIPYSKEDRDCVILFIKSMENDTARKSYYGRYYYMGDEFKIKAGDEKVISEKEKRRNIEIALRCYEIVKSAYIRDVLIAGFVEAKIRECIILLEK